MASSKEYLEYVLEQLRDIEDISCRQMMGEYILYHEGKIFGGIYDDRFLVKDTETARSIIPDAERQLPYEGAREMLAADIDDRELMNRLIPAISGDIKERKRK